MAVNELVAIAGRGGPSPSPGSQPRHVSVIRVTVSETRATLTCVDEATNKTLTYEWVNTEVREFDSDVVNIGQTPFNVDEFALDDVGALFAQAAEVSGSAVAQELQINEYNESRVLMTVTTSPESTTVFFHPDGRMIAHLDFATATDIAEGLRDLHTDARMALAIGVNSSGLWMDVRIDPSTIERRIRPANLPSYTTRRAQTSTLIPFSAEMIDPQAIADVWASLLASGAPSVDPSSASPVPTGAATDGAAPTAAPTGSPQATPTQAIPPLEFTADTRDGQWPPKLYFNFAGRSPVYTLSGELVSVG
jgi:cell division septation protein DedD